MLAPQHGKFVMITATAAKVDNTSVVTAELDTRGYSYVQIWAVMGDVTAALTALAVTESDASGSGHANITGAVFGTSANSTGSTSTLPSATDDNTAVCVDIDMRGRKRYLDVTATVGTASGADGNFIVIFAKLWRADETPDTAAERGAGQVLRVPAYT